MRIRSFSFPASLPVAAIVLALTVDVFGTTLRHAAAEGTSAGPSPSSVEVGLARMEAQVATLQQAVERAKKLDIDTSYEETTLRTAELFGGWIRWDAAHPMDIQTAAGRFTRLPQTRRTELATTWACAKPRSAQRS